MREEAGYRDEKISILSQHMIQSTEDAKSTGKI